MKVALRTSRASWSGASHGLAACSTPSSSSFLSERPNSAALALLEFLLLLDATDLVVGELPQAFLRSASRQREVFADLADLTSELAQDLFAASERALEHADALKAAVEDAASTVPLTTRFLMAI